MEIIIFINIEVVVFVFYCIVLYFYGVVITTGKRPLGRPRRIWEDNIRMDLKEIGINERNWVDSAQDRYYWRSLVKAAMNLRVP